MNKIPDAWEEEWSTAVDDSVPTAATDHPKKVSTKVTKAQKRAQQAEFNRQLWAEAEGPKQTNYFLESRNVVPLRQEYKPPPILLSRKGPIIHSSRAPLTDGINNLSIKHESSDDEDEVTARERSLAERQAQAAKDREEKQRKYEERRLELFGPQSIAAAAGSKSGTSSPGSGTPPQSRSSTPSRGGRRGRGGRGNHNNAGNTPRAQQTSSNKDLFEAIYAPKPDSIYIQRRELGASHSDEILPVRSPKGPDGTGGFNRASKVQPAEDSSVNTPQSS